MVQKFSAVRFLPFLAVQASSIGDHVTHSLTHWLRTSLLIDIEKKNNIIVFRLSRHLIRVMLGHVLIHKKTKTKTKTTYWHLGRLVALLPITIRVFTTLQSEPRALWPLRHLIRVIRRHDMTKKSAFPPTLERSKTPSRSDPRHLWHCTMRLSPCKGVN